MKLPCVARGKILMIAWPFSKEFFACASISASFCVGAYVFNSLIMSLVRDSTLRHEANSK